MTNDPQVFEYRLRVCIHPMTVNEPVTFKSRSLKVTTLLAPFRLSA